MILHVEKVLYDDCGKMNLHNIQRMGGIVSVRGTFHICSFNKIRKSLTVTAKNISIAPKNCLDCA